MKLTRLIIHNIRSIKDADISLADYSILIGSNNAGKSNIITALRLFYEDGRLSYAKDRDFPKFPVDDQESWIELEFTTTPDEQEQLREEYRSADQILKVRRYFASADNDRVKSSQSNIYAYEGGTLSENLFYGAKNVSQQKLGDVIYIPAVSKTDDTLKLSGPSPFRDLVNLVMKKAVLKSDSFTGLSTAFESFNDSFRAESATDGTSINTLVGDINSEISSWDVKFGIDINAIKPEDMVKNLLSQHLEDVALGGEKIGANSHGHGLQRHLVYSLIKLSARYGKSTSAKAKDFNPDFSLILFEEPEAFLHPAQQDVLSHSLRELSGDDTQQVMITSHSSHFVSKNIKDVVSIINVRRSLGISDTWQIHADELEQLLDDNVGLYRAICDHKGDEPNEEGKTEEEAIRYFLFLDAERSSLFFAKHVVICEGATEKALMDSLCDSGWADLKERQIYFLDVMGKYSIHRFVQLLDRLGIPHSILYDADKDTGINKVVNDFVENCTTDLTKGIYCFGTDLEGFLDVPKPNDNHMKPINIVKAYTEGNIEAKRIEELRGVIESIL